VHEQSGWGWLLHAIGVCVGVRFLSLTAILLLLPATPYAALEKEFVFSPAPFASCHASTIVELSDGELIAAWFGGTQEGASDVAIWGSRRSGGHWSPPAELVREPNIPTWNPVLFHTGDGRLWLYYKFGPSPETWSAGRLWSSDEGRSWSRPEHLPAGFYGPIRAKPLVLRDGAIVSGTSVESYRSWAAWIERSSDDGKTWTKFGPITVPQSNSILDSGTNSPHAALAPAEETYGIIQPSIVLMHDQHLRLYARSTSLIGRICVADSFDAGATWTAARPLDLPNPNSGIDAVALRDGRVVLAFNNSSRERTPLNLAVSKDGEHFNVFETLENEPGEYSYPALIQGQDGDLLITYTWKRKLIRYARIPLAEVPQ
jgi:predicted neuraminidase